MEIVINTCHGGFGLSPEGETAYLQRKGKQAVFYVEKPEKPYGQRDYRRVTGEEARGVLFGRVTLTEDAGALVSHAVMWPDGGAHPAYFSGDGLRRDDRDLVAVVRELNGKASGELADLKVVEIPDGVEWTIEEYDGLEWVSEAHRTWP